MEDKLQELYDAANSIEFEGWKREFDKLLKERDERREAEYAELVVRKEAEASLLAYRAVSHRIAMGEDVEAFVVERKAWHSERLKKLQSLKQSTENTMTIQKAQAETCSEDIDIEVDGDNTNE